MLTYEVFIVCGYSVYDTFSQEWKLRDCGGLNEKNPHRLTCLNILSLDGTVWRTRRCGLLEEVSLEVGFEISKDSYPLE